MIVGGALVFALILGAIWLWRWIEDLFALFDACTGSIHDPVPPQRGRR